MSALTEQFSETFRLGGLSVKELARRVLQQVKEDDVTGYAAQLAYYFLFSLFPFFLFLTALLGYIPIPNLMDKIMELLGQVLPGDAMRLVQDNVKTLVSQQHGGLLSFGIIAALWTASSAITAISDALNRAYGVQEGRPFWRVRGGAILLTIGLSVFIVVSMVLLVFGPQIGGWLAGKIGLGQAFNIFWNIARWPAIVVLMILAMAFLYYFAPDVEQDWKWLTPGSVFTVIGWLIVSLGFAYYANHFGSYNATYGSIGAVIVLLTWMYLTGLFILIGGEINSEIEHAAAGGKEPGQKELPK